MSWHRLTVTTRRRVRRRHGPISALRANLVDLAGRYGEDMIVVETSYPWTLRNGDDLETFANDLTDLADATWPPTKRGQWAYYRDLRGVIAAVPRRAWAGVRGLGSGVGAGRRVGAR